jgi:hypothetical protein
VDLVVEIKRSVCLPIAVAWRPPEAALTDDAWQDGSDLTLGFCNGFVHIGDNDPNVIAPLENERVFAGAVWVRPKWFWF